jgi:hypothetical protein
MRPIFEFPQIAVHTVYIFVFAWRCFVVFFVHLFNRVPEPMIACTLSPAPVFHDIVHASFPGVADRLESESSDGTETGYAVASSHVDGVSGMPKVEPAGVLPERRGIPGDWEA